MDMLLCTCWTPRVASDLKSSRIMVGRWLDNSRLIRILVGHKIGPLSPTCIVRSDLDLSDLCRTSIGHWAVHSSYIHTLFMFSPTLAVKVPPTCFESDSHSISIDFRNEWLQSETIRPKLRIYCKADAPQKYRSSRLEKAVYTLLHNLQRTCDACQVCWHYPSLDAQLFIQFGRAGRNKLANRYGHVCAV